MVNRVVRVAVPAALVCLGVLGGAPRRPGSAEVDAGLRPLPEDGAADPRRVKSGAITPTWSADGTSFEYTRDGKRYRYDVATQQATVDSATRAGAGGPRRARRTRGRRRPERGRQFDVGRFARRRSCRARSTDRTATSSWSTPAANAEVAITTDGSEKARIKYGTASWVYGEELGQRTAMWWSPDSRKLAYYRFDEKQVPDYYLQLDQTQAAEHGRRRGVSEGRRAESDRRSVRLRRRHRRRRTQVDVRDGKPFDNDVVGHYVYRVALVAGRHASCCSTAPTAARTSSSSRPPIPTTGAMPRRSSARSGRPAGSRTARRCTFLKDGKRFIWESERNGWSNFYLYDLSGKLIAPLTTHTTFEVGSAREGRRGGRRRLLHGARRRQPHEAAAAPRRSRRQGRRAADRSGVQPHDRRLHARRSAAAAGSRRRRGRAASRPTTRYFVDVYQTHDTPPATRLVDAQRARSSRSSRRAT